MEELYAKQRILCLIFSVNNDWINIKVNTFPEILRKF